MFFFCLRVSYQYREYRINDFHNRYLWSKEFVNDILFIVVYDMTYKFVLHWDRLVLFFFWSEYRINDFIISIYGVKHSQEIFSFSVYMILYDIFYFETGKKKTNHITVWPSKVIFVWMTGFYLQNWKKNHITDPDI